MAVFLTEPGAIRQWKWRRRTRLPRPSMPTLLDPIRSLRYWDDRDGAAAYVLRLTFFEPRTFNELALVGWQHHQFSPRAFTVVCDGQDVATVHDAVYAANEFRLPLPETRASRLELRIGAAYGGSPAVRELEVYHRIPADPGDETVSGRPNLT